jgi:hypothetical protein
MSKDEIVKIVRSYINQSLQGLEIENPKFDFKSKWYNLEINNELSEFLKDTSAIANTFGPDGFLVIGYNDKTKEFKDFNFNDCGLKDSSAITDIINRHIDRQFTINYYEEIIHNHKLGILHIPPSIDKPHVIRSYKVERKGQTREEPHKIFIRKNTQTYSATKYDLELMYYDRKNIVPEYEIHSSFHRDSFNLNYFNETPEDSVVPVILTLDIENTGRRPISVCAIEFVFCEFSDPSSDHDLLKFTNGTDLKSSPIVVSPGTIASQRIIFVSKSLYSYKKGCDMQSSLKTNMHRLGIREMKVILTNGQIISSELTITK